MLIAIVITGPPAYARQACAEAPADTMAYAGTYRSAQLLAGASIAAALQRLLGPKFAHLKRNLAVAAAILSAGKIRIYAAMAGSTTGRGYDAVPLAIKYWLAVVYTRFYFRSRLPGNARFMAGRQRLQRR